MKYKIVTFIALSIVIFSCQETEDYYPKPRGYMRLDFPDRVYEKYDAEGCPFSFQAPKYFNITDKTGCNKDILMERFNATLFLTYLKIDTNLMQNIEYSRKLVYDHSIKADAIDELPLIDPSRKAYGLKYDIKGDAASPYQFYVTDSVNNFLRGALYFNVKPNYDSIRTSLEYLSEDLDQILETIEWKSNEPPLN